MKFYDDYVSWCSLVNHMLIPIFLFTCIVIVGGKCCRLGFGKLYVGSSWSLRCYVVLILMMRVLVWYGLLFVSFHGVVCKPSMALFDRYLMIVS